MGLFWKKKSKIKFEKLPDQIRHNDRIQSWHNRMDGTLTHLVVDGTAESAASKENYRLLMFFSYLTVFIGASVLNSTVFAHVGPSVFVSIVIGIFLLMGLSELWEHMCRDKRICTVFADQVVLERPNGRKEYALTDVVGVHLGRVDQQRIFEEQKKKRKEKEPEYLEPYSMDIFLQTSLGEEDLGSIFGLKEAQKIATGMNAAIQYMKGRQGTAEGPVLNPAHQYRTKTAGQIPA